MPYLMGGFPDLDTSLAVAEAYADAGADLIELGVPYSDPLADGPVIHAAATRALEAGATLESVLEICRRIGDRVPVIPMAYTNMALARGAERFASELAEAGAAGAIVPDLPLEEGGEVAAALRGAGLALVPLVAPTTPPERRARICAQAEGFVYLVSDTRTTGERERLPEQLADLVARHAGRLAGAGRGRLRHWDARAGGRRRLGGRRGHRRHPAGARGWRVRRRRERRGGRGVVYRGVSRPMSRASTR